MIINNKGSVAGALHTGEVVGSIPTAPTIFQSFLGSKRRGLLSALDH
jgi:hypothetical protein